MWKTIHTSKPLKINIKCNCGKDVENYVEKVFHKKIEFSTKNLNINLINDWNLNTKKKFRRR